MDESESDSEACGIVGREEYEEGIYNLKAKEWADSMIVTPHTQPVVSNSKSKRAGSIYKSPKYVVQQTKSSFKVRSVHHSSQNPTAELSKPIPPELSQPVPSVSNEPCEAQHPPPMDLLIANHLFPMNLVRPNHIYARNLLKLNHPPLIELPIPNHMFLMNLLSLSHRHPNSPLTCHSIYHWMLV